MTTLELLQSKGTCLVGRAKLRPVDGIARFQPAGFPEIGHVLYDSIDREGKAIKVCIVDSAASMANHLETVSLAGEESLDLHEDLAGLPYVLCVTTDDGKERSVCNTFTEGHRLASDYFIGPNAMVGGKPFRQLLRDEMQVKELQKDKKYFFYSDSWGDIYKTVFRYDPNSLVHGLLFAREEIKISRVLTAHMEALAASRVLSSGVKFDRLGKTLSGQPIFPVDEEIADEGIVATFVLDLGLVRSYGRGATGLPDRAKQLLIDLALWKVEQLTSRAFRYRSRCHLRRDGAVDWQLDGVPQDALVWNIQESIAACSDLFGGSPTKVQYPREELFRIEEKDKDKKKKGKKNTTGVTEDGEQG
jgi:CRISPR-associated protein Csb1